MICKEDNIFQVFLISVMTWQAEYGGHFTLLALPRRHHQPSAWWAADYGPVMADMQLIVCLSYLIASGRHSTDEDVETTSSVLSRKCWTWGRLERHTGFQGQCGWVCPCSDGSWGHFSPIYHSAGSWSLGTRRWGLVFFCDLHHGSGVCKTSEAGLGTAQPQIFCICPARGHVRQCYCQHLHDQLEWGPVYG
jgi:hypothetical protein